MIYEHVGFVETVLIMFIIIIYGPLERLFFFPGSKIMHQAYNST